MALMQRPIGTARQAQSGTQTPLRRCTFRRVSAARTASRELPVYNVACMFPDRRRAIPLGDIESARPICSACTYQGIFRADSD